MMRVAVAAALSLMIATAATAWTGRRAVLHAEAELLLAENAPYIRGKQDCSERMWKLFCKVFPELLTQKWFHRTTADAMAGWPWTAVMRLQDLLFGDLVFFGHPKIDHVAMSWTHREWIIHATKTLGFAATPLAPYWEPKASVIVRPPY